MPPFDVSPAAPHELLTACRLLFSDGRAEFSRDRILTDAQTCRLFVARAGGKLHAAALVQALPGALGVAWVPRGHSTDALDAVTAAAVAWLRERNVKVCQAFAAPGEAADMAPLERVGFAHTTQLLFLRREIPRGGWIVQRAPQVSLAAESLTSNAFAAALLATHEGTRDCPELNAPRTRDEILAGFTSPGWAYRADHDGEPVGVVLIELMGGLAELSYIGVVPSARGRGFGSDLLTLAMGGAGALGADTLALSVDARNAPAMHLYARHGFAEYDRREVWLLTHAR